MCGIGGFRRFGDELITRDQIELMLISLQSRGTDATGIAIVTPEGKVEVFKDDQPAWKTLETVRYKDWIEKFLVPEVRTVILHTRAATTGNPRQAKNNHPLFDGETAVVHNGVISNHEYLFKEMKLTRVAETDSDVLRAILDEHGFTKKGIRELSRCSGSLAIAAVSNKDPQRLLLARSGSPLVLARAGTMLVWASEKKNIHICMRPWVKAFGLEFQGQRPDLAFLTMADNSAWLFGPEQLEWHDECKTCYQYTEPRRHIWDNYVQRQATWDKKAEGSKAVVVYSNPEGTKGDKSRVACPACGQLNLLSEKQAKKPLDQVRCAECKSPLSKED